MTFVAVGIGAGVMAGAAVAGGTIGRGKKKREVEASKKDYNARMAEYNGLDTSNLYGNLRNTYEDLTVNTQAADFQKQQQMQGQANILDTLKGAAGGSGIASLAQSMAGQSNMAAQQASASIGQQERQNQMMYQQQEASNQQMSIAGAEQARSLQWNKTSTTLGMAQQRSAAASQALAENDAAMWSGIGQAGGMVVGAAVSGIGAGAGTGVSGAGAGTGVSGIGAGTPLTSTNVSMYPGGVGANTINIPQKRTGHEFPSFFRTSTSG